MGRAGAGCWHRAAGSETAAPHPISWTMTGSLLEPLAAVEEGAAATLTPGSGGSSVHSVLDYWGPVCSPVLVETAAPFGVEAAILPGCKDRADRLLAKSERLKRGQK